MIYVVSFVELARTLSVAKHALVATILTAYVLRSINFDHGMSGFALSVSAEVGINHSPPFKYHP
jgi:hypothetical protein